MVDRVNSLAERGFREGLDSGHGVNGPQLVLGGMRPGQGFSAGLGYRRSDLWQERLGYRATVPLALTRFVELNPGDAEAAVTAMRQAGVEVIEAG